MRKIIFYSLAVFLFSCQDNAEPFSKYGKCEHLFGDEHVCHYDIGYVYAIEMCSSNPEDKIIHFCRPHAISTWKLIGDYRKVRRVNRFHETNIADCGQYMTPEINFAKDRLIVKHGDCHLHDVWDDKRGCVRILTP